MSARRGAILSADKRETRSRERSDNKGEDLYIGARCRRGGRALYRGCSDSLSLSLSLAKNGDRFERGDAPPALCAVS